jgi:hypothetical protein
VSSLTPWAKVRFSQQATATLSFPSFSLSEGTGVTKSIRVHSRRQRSPVVVVAVAVAVVVDVVDLSAAGVVVEAPANIGRVAAAATVANELVAVVVEVDPLVVWRQLSP